LDSKVCALYYQSQSILRDIVSFYFQAYFLKVGDTGVAIFLLSLIHSSVYLLLVLSLCVCCFYICFKGAHNLRL